jgi:hypothetical protein
MYTPSHNLRLTFPAGWIGATPAALCAIDEAGHSPSEFLKRHLRGDWGDVCAGDAAANDRAVCIGARILSRYTLRDGVPIWIITEGDRSATTILLPEEY